MIAKTLKLKNKKVTLGRREDQKSFVIQFKKLKDVDFDTDFDKYSETIIEGKIVKTTLCISSAAAVSLYHLLKSELNISDLAAFEIESGQNVFASEK